MSGFRIAILLWHCHEATSESVGASLLHAYQNAPHKSYWNTEVKRARADGLTLIVLKNLFCSVIPWCEAWCLMLEQIEENKWYGCEKKERL